MIQKIRYRLSQWRIRKLRAKILASRGDKPGAWTDSEMADVARLTRMLKKSRRYWSMAYHGGGVVALGLLTEAEARDKVLSLSNEITNVNTNGAFIAVRAQRDRTADDIA